MRAHGWNSVFVRSLLVNLLVCVLVIALVAPLCVGFYRSFYDRQKESIESALQIMLEDLNADLRLLSDMIISTGLNESLHRISIIQGGPKPSDTLAHNKAKDYIAALAQTNACVADCAVVFSRNGIVLTKRAVFYSHAAFDRFYTIRDASLSDWVQASSARGAVGTFFPASALSYLEPNLEIAERLAFCYGVPFNLSQPYGTFFLFVREGSLLDKLPPEFLSSGKFELTTAGGTILYSYQGERWREDSGNIGYLLSSAQTPLQLTAAVNASVLLDMVSGIRDIILMYLLGALVAIVALAVFFTMRQFRPMRSLLDQLRTYGYALPEEWNQMAFVTQAISDMQRKSQDVMKTLASYRDQLHANQIERLLTGWQLVPSALPPANLPARYRVGYAYIAQMNGAQEASLLGALVADRLSQELPAGAILHQLGNGVFALILPEDDGIERMRDRVSALNATLPHPLYLALSEPSEGPENVHTAFEQARMLSLSRGEDGTFLLAEASSGASKADLSAIFKLYQQLMSGQLEEARALIRNSLFILREPFGNIAEVYEHCRMILRFAVRDAALDARLLPPANAAAALPGTLLAQLLESAEAICGAQTEAQTRREAALEREMFRYIQSHLGDPLLNAEMVAKHLAIPERQIHAAIRQTTGDASFSAHLQRERMLLVVQLLAETDAPIAEIADKAGYGTLSTFYKAFKRVHGLSPSEYRLTLGKKG